MTGSVSGMTRYLLAGSEAGESKLTAAKSKKVEIIDEAKLLELIKTLPAGKPPSGASGGAGGGGRGRGRGKAKTDGTSSTQTPSKLSQAIAGRASLGHGRGMGTNANNNNNNNNNNSNAIMDVDNVNPGTGDQLFVEKYKPISSAELIGNETNVNQLKEYLATWYVVCMDLSRFCQLLCV